MRNLRTSNALIKECKLVQKEFFKIDMYWSLMDCLDAVINNNYVKTNSEAIDKAKIELKKIDDLVENNLEVS